MNYGNQLPDASVSDDEHEDISSLEIA